jgi:hypothetical protein
VGAPGTAPMPQTRAKGWLRLGAVRRLHPRLHSRLRLYAPLTWLHTTSSPKVRDSFLWRACVLRQNPPLPFQPRRLRLFDTHLRATPETSAPWTGQYRDLNWPLAINPFANWDG